MNRRKFLHAAAIGAPALVASSALAQSPPAYFAGWWYVPNSSPTANGLALVAGHIYLSPVYIYQPITVEALAARIVTASAGGNFQLGLYQANSGLSPQLTRPGALVDHTASISTATVGEFSANLGSSRSLTAGYYWTGIQCDNAVAKFVSYSNNDPGVASNTGSPFPTKIVGKSSLVTGIFYTNGFGGWPLDLSVLFATEVIANQTAQIAFQVQSVP